MRARAIAALGIAIALTGCAGAEDEAEAGEAEAAATTLTLPFAADTTYRIQHAAPDGALQTIGYVFASGPSPYPLPGVVQEQRWVLYQGSALPGGYVIFDRPGPTRRFVTLDEWKAALDPVDGSIWRSTATYVKVNVAVTGTVTAAQIAHPYYPQLIDEMATVTFVPSEGKPVFQGYAKGGSFEIGGAPTNTESWTTSPGYTAVLDGSSYLLFHVGEGDAMRAATTLGAGSTITTATCAYYVNQLPWER